MKKVLVGLAVLAALAGAFLYGFVGREQRWFPYYPLRDAYRALKPASVPHRYARTPTDTSALAQREAVGALTQLPYLQGYNPASGKTGVLVYDEARAFPGWNLALSAHKTQALLLDMQGLAHQNRTPIITLTWSAVLYPTSCEVCRCLYSPENSRSPAKFSV